MEDDKKEKGGTLVEFMHMHRQDREVQYFWLRVHAH